MPPKCPKEEEKPEIEDGFPLTVEAPNAEPTNTRNDQVDSNSQVYEDYTCILTQTNIGNNNNKFYTIQLLHKSGQYSCWICWGRVGETGQKKEIPCSSLEEAIKVFEKKFWEKTKNKWSNRDSFVAHLDKYTLIKVKAEDGEEGPEGVVKVESVDGVQALQQKAKCCTLDPATQGLVSPTCNNDMLNDIKKMSLEVKKMPLGKLSKQQIAKGLEVLEVLEEALQKSSEPGYLEELSSRFYTIIPHNFGRTRPLTITSLEVLQAEKNMLLALVAREEEEEK